MPAPLRAFISSTMEDLGNERRAVAARLRAFNIEPVFAEELPPNGTSSWRLLEEEIKSCELFILLLGTRYGWVPTKGPGSGSGFSVTHLEANVARRHSLLILPFFKNLRRSDPEDKQRDAFRKEIEDWEAGYFRQTFDWAEDLADRVSAALSYVLTEAFRRALQDKSTQASVQTAGTERDPVATLHQAIAEARWAIPEAVLLAGAGMSLAAGFPTAATLTEMLAIELGVSAGGTEVLHRHGFAEVAEFYERKFDRLTLVERMSGAIPNPGAFGPTRAHNSAVRAFRTIVTTNLDRLFEIACEKQNFVFKVATPSRPNLTPLAADERLIFKINGSIEDPASLVLTEADISKSIASELFWHAIENRLRKNPLVVVGHSLRDAPSQRVPQAKIHDGGAFVSPFLDAADGILLLKHNLTGIRMDADSFMLAYEQELADRSTS